MSRKYRVAGTLILLLAALLRFERLDRRPYHHDEAIHGYQSYQIARVMRQGIACDYLYDPVYHGPFLYYVTGAVFAVLGDSDTTGRLATAFSGLFLVLLPLCFAKELTRKGAFIASFLLAISPVQVTFSRFLRNDAFLATEAIVFLAFFYRGAVERRRLPGILAIAALALAFTTKESAYLVALSFAAILITFGLFELADGRGKLAKRLSTLLSQRIGLVQGLLTLLGFALFNLSGALLRHHDPAIQALVAGLLLLAIACLAIAAFKVTLDHVPIGKEAEAALRAYLNPAIGIVVFAFIFLVAFTNAFTHLDRLRDGLFSALVYWTGQQQAPRLDGPFLYYLPILLIHEPVSLLLPVAAVFLGARKRFRLLVLSAGAATAAIVISGDSTWLTGILNDACRHAAAGRNLFDLAVAFSLVILFVGASWRSFRSGDLPLAACLLLTLYSFLLYAWAREKVPWLTVHVALPFTLVTALLLRRTKRWKLIIVLAVASLAAFHSHLLAVLSGECNTADPLVYVQTIPRARLAVEKVEKLLADGRDLQLQDDVTVPFYWYFRRQNVTYPKELTTLDPRTVYLTDPSALLIEPDASWRRERVAYYAWQVPEFAEEGMGWQGLVDRLTWLPHYLLFRAGAPFRKGTMRADLLWYRGELGPDLVVTADGAEAAPEASAVQDSPQEQEAAGDHP